MAEVKGVQGVFGRGIFGRWPWILVWGDAAELALSLKLD